MYPAHISIDPLSSRHRIQTCTEHARSVAALAKDFLSPLELVATGEIAGLLHDLGKYTEEFRTYLDRATRGEMVVRGSVIHTFSGVRYMLEQFHSHDGSLPLGDLASELLAISIGSHHGLLDLWNEYHQGGFDHRLNHQPDYDKRAMEAFHAECASADEVRQLYTQAEREICRFYTQRIGSWKQSYEEVLFALSLLSRLITSAVVDADRTDTRCFMDNQPIPANTLPSWDQCAEQLNATSGSSLTARPSSGPAANFLRAVPGQLIFHRDCTASICRLVAAKRSPPCASPFYTPEGIVCAMCSTLPLCYPFWNRMPMSFAPPQVTASPCWSITPTSSGMICPTRN